MAIRVVVPREPEHQNELVCMCELLADTEADILRLGEIVDDGFMRVSPEAGSFAYTADMTAIYQLSPSGTWEKVGD